MRFRVTLRKVPRSVNTGHDIVPERGGAFADVHQPRGPTSDDPVGQHGVRDLPEASDIGALDVIAMALASRITVFDPAREIHWRVVN
jgi:hypothetical protein